MAELWNRTAPTQLHAASFYHWWVSRCKVQLIRHDVQATFWIEAKLLMSLQSIQFPFTKHRQDIGALPGVSRWGTSSVVDFLKQPVADGLSSVLLFGVPDKVWRQTPGALNSVADMEIHSFRWRREKMELQENAKKTLLWRRWGASFLCDVRSLEELSELKTGSDQKEPVKRKRVREACAM